MTAQSVFKSSHEDVLRWWEDEWAASLRRFNEKVAEWLTRFPDCHALTMTKGDIGKHVVGLDARPDSGEWVPIVRHGITYGYRPKKNTKDGKAEARVMASIAHNPSAPPEMPTFVFSGDDCRWCSPGLFEHDGVVFVSWGCPAEQVNAGPKWEPCLLSEFYAAQEAAR